MSNDYDFFLNKRRIRQSNAKQMTHNALCDVTNVACALLHVSIVGHSFEHFDKHIGYAL